MNFEHQADLTKLPSHWMAVRRLHRFRECLLKIDFAASARNTWNAFGGNSFLDSIPVPPLAKTLRPYVDIILIVGMPNIIGRSNHTQGGDPCELVAQECRVLSALLDHTWQFSQQHAPDCRLYFSEPPIRSKGFVEKAVSRWMMARIHRLIALAVVLETPT